jgi:hypothetical protein
MTAAAVTALAQNNLYLGLILFKIVGLICHLLIAVLIWLLAGGETVARRRAALLWAWNPALLLTFVVDAHNDSLMLLWLLLGFWFAQNGPKQWSSALRFGLGFTLMSLAPLTKPIGLLPLPFFLLAFWRQLPDTAARLRFLLLSIVGSLAALGLTFLPFGSPLALVARLAQEAGTGGGFSITTVLLLLNQRLSGELSWAVLTNTTRVIAGVIVLWLLWRTWHGRSPLRAAADIFALYIFQALNFRIWYSVWAVPWLILENGGTEHQDGENTTPHSPLATHHSSLSYRLRVGLLFLLITQLSVLIYGHLRVYALGGDHFPAHLIGVPFTFGLPFLLALKNRQ